MYNYESEKNGLFTDDGQRMFLSVRDKVNRLIKQAGCVRMDSATEGQSGCAWAMLACVDRMVELGEIKEINYGECAGQYRIFTRFPTH
jgi:hypothetical protein